MPGDFKKGAEGVVPPVLAMFCFASDLHGSRTNRYYLVIGPCWDTSVITIYLQQRQRSINTFNPLRELLIGLAMIAVSTLK